ncbi:NAD(+) synthase [Moheibacter sediminis]|uniref:NH(3)-dependent NAD(+) synthetase n=1 Tax=Moheibacter sediminis TaxID=1434700 RepID=A0A1W1YKW3_9FLAO|nr:NAD(+) synthase [Moheibacter sediminis]SMC36870.1 NAD+ synthase [Moheibacter sediminis]
MQTEKIINHIVEWLQDYLINSKQNGFVIGISGGIDSAVTSTLCAMTGYPVLCLEMPIHQAPNQVSRALKHIDWLKKNYEKISSASINLTPVYDEFVNVAEKSDNEYSYSLSLANTRARLRMTTLYYYAGLNGYIVAGTGNKVEDFGVGFFTKYGDGGVDISPIADLMKSEVYKIAEFLGINQDIQQAAPTDGLFGDNRTDEDQMGASYDELEWAMKAAAKGQKSDDFSGREKVVFEIFEKRHKANLHKMIPIPVCGIPEDWK